VGPVRTHLDRGAVTIRRGRIAALAAVALALAGSGCGTGPNFDFTPPGDFDADVGRLCLDEAQAAATAQMDLGQARTAAEEAANLRGIAAAAAAEDGSFEAIVAPQDRAAGYADFLAARDGVAEATESYAVALEGEQPAEIVAGRRALDAAREEMWRAGAELGLRTCSGRLSQIEERAVTATVERIDTSSDPAEVCEGMVFDSYVESAFGGLAECRRFQRDAGNTASSIDVDAVAGTDGVIAVVDFRDVAGPFDGRPLRATLFPSDGKWLLWNVVELSDRAPGPDRARP
jgi:hypothetical protein